jgi:LPXTG-motif cell wall-anchored protein
MTDFNYRWWKLVPICLAICACVFCGCAPIEGASVAKPGARMRIDPIRGFIDMESTRDDKATLDELEVIIPEKAPGPLAGSTLKVKGLDMDASASKVRYANVPQIGAMDDFNRGALQGWANVIDSAGNAIVSPVMGRLYPNTGAETAKSFTIFGVLLLGLVVLVVLIKLWTWLFPSKNPMQEMLVAMMANQRPKT